MLNRIRFSAPGYATEYVTAAFSAPEVVWLRQGQRISGICVDSRGQPVSGLRLRLEMGVMEPDVTVTADKQGRFATTEAGAHAYRLVVCDSGWIANVSRLVPPVDDLRVVVYRPARFRGRLQFSGSGTCWKSLFAWVQELRTEPPGFSIRTDHDDAFAFDCVPGRVTLMLDEHVVACVVLREGETCESGVHTIPLEACCDPGNDGDPDRVQGEGEEHDPDPLNAAGRIRGFLMGPGGEPITHGSLSLCRTGTRRTCLDMRECRLQRLLPRSVPTAQATSSFQNGYFDLGGVASGSYDLVWTPAGLQSGLRAVLCRGIRMADPPVDVDLGALTLDMKTKALTVRVVYADGSGVSGAIVRVMDGRLDEAAVRTDATGRATLRVFDPTGLRFQVEGPRGSVTHRDLPEVVGSSVPPITIVVSR